MPNPRGRRPGSGSEPSARASNTGAASADHGGRANSGINIEGLHIVLPSGRLLPVVLAAIILALVGGVASLSREGERIPPQAAAPSGQPSPSPTAGVRVV
ncbi:hypothetical protein, partial [Streptomyces sp. IBSBF 2435]|uniref:hypothetical protein n=1 Tax=Streptomyces sp. IBSBF 2435 TaxID=2903531 RepID=UPI002FDC5027